MADGPGGIFDMGVFIMLQGRGELCMTKICWNQFVRGHIRERNPGRYEKIDTEGLREEAGGHSKIRTSKKKEETLAGQPKN